MLGNKSKHGYFYPSNSLRTVTVFSVLFMVVLGTLASAALDSQHNLSDETETLYEPDSANISYAINSSVISSTSIHSSPDRFTILQSASIENSELENNSSYQINKTSNPNINIIVPENQNYTNLYNDTDTVSDTTPASTTQGREQGEEYENTEGNVSVEYSVNTTVPAVPVDPDFLRFLNKAHNNTDNGNTNTTSNPQTLNITNQRSQFDQRSTHPAPAAARDINFIKDKALENLMHIFGLAVNPTRDVSPGPAPEFMIDLYNTITDSYGVTRAKNPYNAHVVRSFTERDNSLNDFFYFNISGLEESETVLEAELHIHRTQTPHEQLHPSLYLTPFYILSLYQVLDPKNLAIPDLHKLLGVHYVPALGSGWEVFNVKQPVLKWMEGNTQPNHGFLVAATSLGGDRVPVRFSRRGENASSKQPILVLFTHDSEMKVEPPTRSPVKSKNLSRPIQRTLGTDSVNINTVNETGRATTGDEESENIPTSSLENPRYHHALLFQDSIRHPNSVGRFRSRRSKNQTEGHSHLNDTNGSSPRNLTFCGRHDLFVSFEAIGWSSWIISPKGYNAFYCDGPCSFPLGQQVNPSNHATVQSIVHELNLAPDVGRPCCVPTRLLPISLLYYDNHDNVVLKQYVDMVADSCGCF